MAEMKEIWVRTLGMADGTEVKLDIESNKCVADIRNIAIPKLSFEEFDGVPVEGQLQVQTVDGTLMKARTKISSLSEDDVLIICRSRPVQVAATPQPETTPAAAAAPAAADAAHDPDIQQEPQKPDHADQKPSSGLAGSPFVGSKANQMEQARAGEQYSQHHHDGGGSPGTHPQAAADAATDPAISVASAAGAAPPTGRPPPTSPHRHPDTVPAPAGGAAAGDDAPPLLSDDPTTPPQPQPPQQQPWQVGASAYAAPASEKHAPYVVYIDRVAPDLADGCLRAGVEDALGVPVEALEVIRSGVSEDARTQHFPFAYAFAFLKEPPQNMSLSAQTQMIDVSHCETSGRKTVTHLGDPRRKEWREQVRVQATNNKQRNMPKAPDPKATLHIRVYARRSNEFQNAPDLPGHDKWSERLKSIKWAGFLALVEATGVLVEHPDPEMESPTDYIKIIADDRGSKNSGTHASVLLCGFFVECKDPQEKKHDGSERCGSATKKEDCGRRLKEAVSDRRVTIGGVTFLLQCDYTLKEKKLYDRCGRRDTYSAFYADHQKSYQEAHRKAQDAVQIARKTGRVDHMLTDDPSNDFFTFGNSDDSGRRFRAYGASAPSEDTQTRKTKQASKRQEDAERGYGDAEMRPIPGAPLGGRGQPLPWQPPSLSGVPGMPPVSPELTQLYMQQQNLTQQNLQLLQQDPRIQLQQFHMQQAAQAAQLHAMMAAQAAQSGPWTGGGQMPDLGALTAAAGWGQPDKPEPSRGQEGWPGCMPGAMLKGPPEQFGWQGPSFGGSDFVPAPSGGRGHHA